MRPRRGRALRTSHQQHERQHREENNPQQLKQTDERDHRRLPLDHAADCRVGAVGCRDGVGAGRQKRRARLGLSLIHI